METCHPKHHVLVDQVTQPSGKTMRIILLENGPFQPLIEYFGVKNRAKSPKWQEAVARSIGLFIDYIIQMGPLYRDEARAKKIFWDWVDAIEYGTVGTDGIDRTQLFWPEHSYTQTRNMARHVKEFSDYCAEKYGADQLVPDREATLLERLSIYRRLDHKSGNSFLKHLETNKCKWESTRRTNDLAHAFEDPGQTVKWVDPPRFRQKDFAQLVSSGFLKRGGEKQSKPYLKWHIRDMMISILQGTAGLRASEPFHLWIDDVIENPRMPGHALVKLFHPSKGKYTYVDTFNETVTTTRLNYLKSVGMTPRHLSGKSNYHAGWKKLALYEEPITREIYAPVTFFPFDWGAIFWDLYCFYIMYVRPTDVGHPFLFVTERGKTAGEPYALKQYVKKHDAAIGNLFNKVATKREGTTTHALRYMYANQIEKAVAGLEDGKKFIQMCLRHRSILSQEVYVKPKLGEIMEVLHQRSREMSIPKLIDIVK